MPSPIKIKPRKIDFEFTDQLPYKKNLQWLLQLAVSCALEHFTALFSEQLLSKQYFKDYAHPVYAKLWIWHTIEEIEHKAVCYDVYQAVAGGFLGYLERCFVMLCTSLIFLTMIITSFLFISLPNAKKKSKSSTKDRSLITELSFLFFNKDGLIKQIMLSYLAYYAPGFHPWQKNNLPLIEQWKANYENGIFLQIDGTTATPPKQSP